MQTDLDLVVQRAGGGHGKSLFPEPKGNISSMVSQHPQLLAFPEESESPFCFPFCLLNNGLVRQGGELNLVNENLCDRRTLDLIQGNMDNC